MPRSTSLAARSRAFSVRCVDMFVGLGLRAAHLRSHLDLQTCVNAVVRRRVVRRRQHDHVRIQVGVGVGGVCAHKGLF